MTDGMVRDIEGLEAVGIPVFARGLTPNAPHRDGPGAIGEPVTLGGVIVQPLVAAPWGDTFGAVNDKFGVKWMVNISGHQE